MFKKPLVKLPVTDKFLWKLYDLIEKADNTIDTISPMNMTEVVYPDIRRLQNEYKKEKSVRKFSQFMRYLQNKGYIKTKSIVGTEGIMFTTKGAKKALRAKRKLSEKKKRKDGSWIMVIFDIPTKLGPVRHTLRDHLVELGYQQLQKSVWVCPYDVHKETEEIVRELSLMSHIKIFFIKELV